MADPTCYTLFMPKHTVASASDVASALGLSVRDFQDKKTGKSNPNKIVVKAYRNGQGNVQLAAFRKMTGLVPLKVKVGNNRLIAVFGRKSLESKKLKIPTLSKE